MSTWTMHTGDALTVLPTLPAATVDLVVADPPYNSGGRDTASRVGQNARRKYVSTDAAPTLPDFPGDQRDQRGYTYWLTLILAECHRLARDGASTLVFCDYRQLAATSDALQGAGWQWRGAIPWRKPISRPQRDGFRRECEYILWGSRGTPYRHTPTLYLPGWYEASQPRGSKRHHITAKPVEMLADLIRICPPDGTVLDPCAGSGSTGVAALNTGRSFIGVELTEHYSAVARERLAAATNP